MLLLSVRELVVISKKCFLAGIFFKTACVSVNISQKKSFVGAQYSSKLGGVCIFRIPLPGRKPSCILKGVHFNTTF